MSSQNSDHANSSTTAEDIGTGGAYVFNGTRSHAQGYEQGRGDIYVEKEAQSSKKGRAERAHQQIGPGGSTKRNQARAGYITEGTGREGTFS